MFVSLSKIADILIISTCVLLIGTLVIREWLGNRDTPQQERRPAKLTGRQIAQPVGQHEAIVILQLSADCMYCSKSVPFYRDLKALVDRSRQRLFLATQFLNPEAEKAFLGSHQLTGITGLGPPPPGLSTGFVPTVLLADKSGRIVKAWTGYLDKRQQSEVLSAISRLCQDCNPISVPEAAP